MNDDLLKQILLKTKNRTNHTKESPKLISTTKIIFLNDPKDMITLCKSKELREICDKLQISKSGSNNKLIKKI